MRSVSVVLPESMCAEIPMFRIRSMSAIMMLTSRAASSAGALLFGVRGRQPRLLNP